MGSFSRFIALLLVVLLTACGGGSDSTADNQESTDTTPPTAARVVALIATTPNSVQLAWLPSEDDHTAQTAIKYEIHKASTSGFQPGPNTLDAMVEGDVEYTLEDLQADTEYYLRIVSTDAADNQTLSEAEHRIKTPATVATPVEDALLEKAVELDLAAPIQKTATEMRFRLDDFSEIPTIGAVLVGQDQNQGGYLVRVIQVSTEGDEVVIQTEQAAVSDILDTADIHSEFQLFDTNTASTDTAGRLAAKSLVSAKGLRSSHMGWESGILSVSQEEYVPYTADPIAYKAYARAARKVAARSVVDADLALELNVPAYKLFVAGESQAVRVSGRVLDETLGTQFVDIQLVSVTHQINSSGEHFGMSFIDLTGTSSNDALIKWHPGLDHVSPYPYIVTVRATPYARPDISVDTQIEIYVSEGRHKVISDENESISLSFDLEFEPKLVTDIKLRKISKRVESAEVYAQGNLDLNALAEYNFSAEKSWDVLRPVFKKTYNSVYLAGPVPVYQRITFSIDAQLTANAQSKINASAEATASSFVKFGVRYTNAAGWQMISDKGFTNEIVMDLGVRGDVSAELRLIPKIEVAFYEVAMSDLSIEPYIKGALGAEYVAHADLLNLDAYSQYQMTECSADLGIDVYVSATLDIWVKKFELYPRTRLWHNEWPLYSLPELTLSADANDSNLLIAEIADGVNNAFNSESIGWSIYPSTAAITPDPNDPRKARFSAETPDEYMIFFSGYGNLGPIGRNYTSHTIDTGKDSDGDGMPDKWENRYAGLDPEDGSDGSDDEDADGLNNAQEYAYGSNPNSKDTDGDGMPDHWEATYGFSLTSNSDAVEDADWDGISNLDEYLNGTSPRRLDVNLIATSGDASVSLSWNHLSSAGGYTLYYAEQSGITMDNYAGLSGGSRLDIGASFNNQASHTVNGLENGKTYYFILSAKVGTEESLPTAEVSTTPESGITIPVAPTGLTAVPGDGQIDLSWNPVTEAVSYNLYYATESFAGLSNIGNYGALAGGTLRTNQTSPMTLTGLTNATRYYLVVTAVNSAGEGPASIEASAIPVQQIVIVPLNDTGITWGGNYPSGNNASCIGEEISAQDCSHGRDATHNNDSDGHAGFSFTKIDANGNELPTNASNWSCVKDNVTGLMWEKKVGGNGIVGDEGLHDADDTYNWYNTDPNTNGGSAGSADDDGAICYGYDSNDSSTYCNTQAYVARVNATGLCGHHDWHLPKKQVLNSIVDYSLSIPPIDSDWFPNTQSSHYWSSSIHAMNTTMVWVAPFGGAAATGYHHSSSYYVWLVRAGQ